MSLKRTEATVVSEWVSAAIEDAPCTHTGSGSHTEPMAGSLLPCKKGKAMELRIVAKTGHPDFLDLPWHLPLEEWQSDRLVEVPRGISRHVVRFVGYDDVVYAHQRAPRTPRRT